LDELYAEAEAKREHSDPASAAASFDRVVELDSEGSFAPKALFQAAESHDLAGKPAEAQARYDRLVRTFPKHPLARVALVRNVRLSTYLDRWPRAGELGELLLTRYQDLRPLEKIVAYSGKAFEMVAKERDDLALRYVDKARDLIETDGLDRAGRLSPDVAAVYFALGEARRMRAERIHFSDEPRRLPELLEQRCQLLLDAQSAYSDSMRAYDAHWSTMAGYRVGELYQSLHRDLMQVPAPRTADTDERRQLFEGAMRLRYSVLLSKARAMIEHTLSMAERTVEQTSWVLKAKQAKESIERDIQREEQTLAALPYTRRQLETALRTLGKTGPR
jgi:tetratricopeptide (TPR) repeat protein